MVFNFRYLPSGCSEFTWARMWGSVVIFRNQKGSASRKGLGNTALHSFIRGKISSIWYHHTTPAGVRARACLFLYSNFWTMSPIFAEKRPECLATTEQRDGVRSNFLQSVMTTCLPRETVRWLGQKRYWNLRSWHFSGMSNWNMATLKFVFLRLS
jgi:hypothetical protein